MRQHECAIYAAQLLGEAASTQTSTPVWTLLSRVDAKRSRGKEEMNYGTKTYECSFCGKQSSISCTVNSRSACVGCFVLVCRNIEDAKSHPRESRR